MLKLQTLVALGLAAAGVFVAPSLTSPPEAATPVEWTGEVIAMTTRNYQSGSGDVYSIDTSAHSTTYSLAAGAVDTNETSWTVTYVGVEESSSGPCSYRRLDRTGSGDGVGGGPAITVDFGAITLVDGTRQAGYTVSTGGLVQIDTQNVLVTSSWDGVHGTCNTEKSEFTNAIRNEVGRAFFAVGAEPVWVLQGTYRDTSTPGQTYETAVRLRRTNCDGAPDDDGDGLNICQEFDLRTDPNNRDTDGGGVEDGAEVAAGGDPNNPADDPAPPPDPGSNAAPTAEPDSTSTTINTAVTIDVTANDSDGDEDVLSVSTCSSPPAGLVSISGPFVTFTPYEGFQGVATFTCTVQDGRGGFDSAVVTVVVGGVQSPPVAACAADAQRESQTFDYSASIGASHLFNFSPIIVYCWDGVNAQITKALVYGWVDPGFFLGGLDALGFETTYNENDQHADIAGNRVTITGDFEMAYNLTGLFDKIGVKEKIEKYAGQKLGRKFAKTILKDGYNGEFDARLQEFVVFTTEKVRADIEHALRGVYRALPDELARDIEILVLQEVDKIFDQWYAQVQTSLTGGELVGWTAEEVSGWVVSSLLAQLDELTTVHYSVWTPTIQIAVGADGQLSVTTDQSYVHPLLTVTLEP